MNRRHVLLAAAAAWVMAASPSLARPLDPLLPQALVFTGATAGVERFTLFEPTRIDFDNATIDMAGEYGGVVIFDARGIDYGGTIRFRALESDRRAALPVLPQRGQPLYGYSLVQPTLEPGTYTAYLLADAQTEVRLPLADGRGQEIPVTGAVKRPAYRAELHLIAPDVDDEPDTWTRSYSFRQPARALTLLVAQFASHGTAEEPRLATCLTRLPDCRGPGIRGTAKADRTLDGDSIAVWTGRGIGDAGVWHNRTTLTTERTGGGRVRLLFLHLVL